VDAHVLVQIAFLSEALPTSFYRTKEWLLACVRSQMVKQIVPFLKTLIAGLLSIAGLVLTEENLSPPFAVVFIVLYVLKGKEARNVRKSLF
jgi:siroheme synthase